MTKKRLLEFDAMRALAIFIILFHHLTTYSFNFYDLNNFGIPLNLSELNQLNRYLGLGLFVFLSGYFINIKEKDFLDVTILKSFFYKRFLRIFPLYYLAIPSFIYMYRLFDISAIVTQLFGLQLLLSSPSNRPFPTLWFIGILVFYYSLFVIFKISLSLQSSVIKNMCCASLFLLLPIIVILIHKEFNLMDLRILIYYPIFWFGVFCSETNFLEKKNKYLWLLFLPLFVGVQLIFLYNYLVNSIELLGFLEKTYIVNLMIISSVILIYDLCKSFFLFYQKSEIKIIKIISYSSYCIFLFHRPIWFTIGKINDDFLKISDLNIILIINIFLGIPLIVLLSNVLQSNYDKLVSKILYK